MKIRSYISDLYSFCVRSLNIPFYAHAIRILRLIVGKIKIDPISTHTIREEISCWIWIWSLNFNSAHAFRWNSTLKICNLMIGILHILVECMHPYRKIFGPWIKNSEAFAIFRASTILELVISNHQVYGYISSKNSAADSKKFKIFESAHANFLRKDFL